MFDLIVAIITASGLIGVAALMLAENVVPPIPSEVVMPLAGFAAARGELSFPGVVAAGTAGALLGATLWFAIGHALGTARLKRWAASHGRWLTLSPEDVDRASAFFAKWGGPAVLLGRLVPGVRTYISVPAGMARMRLVAFLAWTSVGTAVWTWFLAYAGYHLEAHYDRVSAWLDPVTTGVLLIGAATYVYRVLTFRSSPPA